jgi:hypothetical protein
MYYDDHPPPQIHAEYQGNKAKIDFGGNVLLGDLRSKTEDNGRRQGFE